MGKVIPTLTNTTYITKILPQNCPKTTSKLPQNFWIWRFEAKKKCLKTFGLVETPPPPFGKNSYLSHHFYLEVFPN